MDSANGLSNAVMAAVMSDGVETAGIADPIAEPHTQRTASRVGCEEVFRK
jgi:hypothetical protein